MRGLISAGSLHAAGPRNRAGEEGFVVQRRGRIYTLVGEGSHRPKPERQPHVIRNVVENRRACGSELASLVDVVVTRVLGKGPLPAVWSSAESAAPVTVQSKAYPVMAGSRISDIAPQNTASAPLGL